MRNEFLHGSRTEAGDKYSICCFTVSFFLERTTTKLMQNYKADDLFIFYKK